MYCSIPGFSVLHYFLEFAQAHVHWDSDTIQPSHPLSPPSLPAPNLSQHWDPFQWVGSLHHVAKVLELQHQSFQWSEVKWSEVAQSCPTLSDPMNGSLPGSSIHGIFQARILEWVAISFSRRSSQPRDWTQVSRNVGRLFTMWGTRETGGFQWIYLLRG